MLTLSTTIGRLLATAQDKYQVYLRRTANTYIGPIPIGLRTTLGNASVVLVTISKEREIGGSLSQVVRTMEDNQIQIPGSESSPIRVAPPQRETLKSNGRQ